MRQDFKLDVAQVEAQVTVEGSGEQPLVDPSRTVVGSTLTRQQIDELPIESRNIFDLIFTLAGVSPEAFSLRDLAEGETKDRFRSTPEEAGVFALNGGTPFSNNLTIEGLDNNDDRAARERFTPSMDAVEEFQVITNQFRRSMGALPAGASICVCAAERINFAVVAFISSAMKA